MVSSRLSIALIFVFLLSIGLVTALVHANGIVVVEINSPMNTTYSTTSIAINVTASSYSAIDRVLAEIDHVRNVTLVRSGFSNFYTATEEMAEGQHFIRIFAYDVEGNLNSQQTVYFTIAVTKDLGLVVRGYTGIFYKTYSLAQQTWSDWHSLDGITIDAPSATIVGNTLYAGVRGQNYDQIWVRSVNLTSGALSAWTLIDGSTPSGPAIASTSDSLVLVVRGYTGIFYKTYSLAQQTWSDWHLVDGQTNDAPSATIIGDTMYLCVRGLNDDQIWVAAIDLKDNSCVWTLIDGSTPSGPAIASTSDSLVLVVRGYTGIFYKTYSLAQQTWSDWHSLDGITIDAPSATIVGNTLYAGVRGQNYDQIWVRSVNLTSGALSAWTLIDGSTPSGPAIAP